MYNIQTEKLVCFAMKHIPKYLWKIKLLCELAYLASNKNLTSSARALAFSYFK